MTDTTDTETDEPTKDELEQRVEQLEKTVQKMLPNRRQMLKGMATAGAAGALGFGAGSASAAPGDDGDTVWGSSSNRDDYYVDEMNANNVVSDVVNTDSASIGTSASGVTAVADVGPFGETRVSDKITLADDSSVQLIPAFAGSEPARLMIVSTSASESAILTAINSSITIQESFGPWATSDSDTNHCVFRDGSNNLDLKNRTGSSQDYTVWIDYLDVL